MQETVLNLLSWASTEALATSEPVILLVLGALFLALSFSVQSRRSLRAMRTGDPETGRAMAHGKPALAGQRGH
jgi:hypothetical protein